MRNLLYYKLDNDFVSGQTEAGGDGTKVVSFVDGIAWVNDAEKSYYNPHDETILTRTLTVNYTAANGKVLAPSETISFDYIPGKTSKIVLTPKNVEDYTPKEYKKVVFIPKQTVVRFEYTKNTPIDYSQPLTFNIVSGGTIKWTLTNEEASYNHRKTLEYSKNDGPWYPITSRSGSSAPSISVNAGDKVQFRGINSKYYDGPRYFSTFSGSTALFTAEGNIMSLINSHNYATLTAITTNEAFRNLFNCCTSLTSAENLILPATTLAENCYCGMFANCTSLTTAPELPATTLADNCYDMMFRGCISLATAPSLPATTLAMACYEQMFYSCVTITMAPELPATTLAHQCYRYMFNECTSLTVAPELPATTLANSCYSNMFQSCTSLTTAPAVLPATTLASSCYLFMFSSCVSLMAAPALPATTLAESCYSNMFYKCISLTVAPELPATTLANSCYLGMFSSCANLNYIKSLATDISARDCTTRWVERVASSGTFVKSPNITEQTWRRGDNGIPYNWIVEDAS